MPIPKKDTASKPTTGKPDAEDDALIYRVPDLPPARHTVRVNEDGTFTYEPSFDAEDPDKP